MVSARSTFIVFCTTPPFEKKSRTDESKRRRYPNYRFPDLSQLFLTEYTTLAPCL